MGRLAFAVVVGVIWWVLSHDDARDELAEIVRDVSDRLMMGVLRVTSGFASDVSPDILREERERRLRWR